MKPRTPAKALRSGALSLILLGCAVSSPSDLHTVEGALDFGGLLRTYHVHVPPGLDAARPLPLVFVLHGGGGSGLQMERFSRFSALSDREGFIACYPDGVD